MTDPPNDIAALKALIKRLWGEIQRFEAENAKLRRRLGLDSSNNHKPPSSNGDKKPQVKPGLPKDAEHAKGGQSGHQGRTLKRVDNPDPIKAHLPQHCECCGRQFSADEAHHILQMLSLSKYAARANQPRRN